MRLRLNPLAQNGLSVVEPTIVNSTTSSSTTGGGTVPTSVDDLSPSQTGNAGKFLKTDGTNATWESIPGGGDMLTTNNLSDLTDAAIARTNLGVDAAGTDNSTNVTLAGTGTYISLTGQQITVDPITESDITDLNHAVDAVSNVATSTILGRVTAGSGNSEELTAAQVRTLINVADGATANSSDATLLARANHTGTQSADTITDGTTNKAYTATEQSKLAGIETGATADQTANEILTAIKTVDGTLSGLDADLLDGNEATAFATSAQGALADSAVQPIDLATVATTGSYSDLSSTPTLGTAAAKNIPATGDASATEVVYGTDTRLTDARTPTAHTHTASAVTDFDTAVAANSAVAANTAKVGVTTQISNIVEDTTPQLGGNLDSNGHNIQVKGTNGTMTITSDTDGGEYNIGVDTSGTLAIYGAGANTLNVSLLDGNISMSSGATVDGRDVSADGTKLDGIETGADVTDATNVDAAGATMNSDTSLVGNSYFLDEDNMASDSATKVASQQSIKAYVDAAITATKSALFPVGAIYASTVSTNPGTLLGFGTWAAYGAGRVMVGKAASGTFATGGATGGAETHTLSEAEMPSHTHTQNAHTHTQNAHTHGIGTRISGFTGYGQNSPINGNAANSSGTTSDSTTATNQNTTATNQNAGSGSAHNNLQPYIVTYLWERTA